MPETPPSFLSKFKSRKFLLALIAQVAGIAVLFYPHQEEVILTAADQIAVIATNVMALFFMGLTAWGYIDAEGAVDAARATAEGQKAHADADVKKAVIDADAAAGKDPATGQSWRQAGKPLTMLMVAGTLLAVGASTGCATTPEGRWYQQRDALTTANRVYLAQTPRLTDDQIVFHGELLRSGRSALEDARQRLPEGGPLFDASLDVVESILKRWANQEVTDDSPRTADDVSDRAGAAGFRAHPASGGPAERHAHAGAEGRHPRRSAAYRRPGGSGHRPGKGTHRGAGFQGRLTA